MSQRNNITLRPLNASLLGKRMLLGAMIGLALITLFLSGVDDPHPDWPQYWWVRPLVVVPIAGAMGAAFSCFIEDWRNQNAWQRILATVISLIVFLVALWLGSVFGLDGTLWN